MKELKCAYRENPRGFQFIAMASALPNSGFWFLSREKSFLEKRTQTLPAIIDDREKTNPKRTQIKP
jgi:hypothetical protein